MTERGGNCKFFAPNYFNPTKCQNCFKQKEQHAQESADNKTLLSRKSSAHAKSLAAAKVLLKEGILQRAGYNQNTKKLQEWETHFFRVYSNGELQCYHVNNVESEKEPCSSIFLHDYIRMLDGKDELGEDFTFGIKTLRDTTFFKAKSKVEYVNWWKEFSTFVSAPLKRTISYSPSHTGGYNKSSVSKQYSIPISSLSSKVSTLSSRSSSVSSLLDADNLQMDGLRNKISKLEDENSKLSKAEADRRKLELEVNYWKEYVTNAQALRKSGMTIEVSTELADARKSLIHLQDELNETQKKLRSQNGKLVLQNKELADMKEKLLEANSITAVYKAKNDQLSREIANKSRDFPPMLEDVFYREGSKPLDNAPVDVTSAQHLEDKFLVLKDRLKRIERDLFLKSKELEKANESRSKVAKYTRSLLQELETRLSDTQAKYNDSEEKLKNTQAELALERDRRLKNEDSVQRKNSVIGNWQMSEARSPVADFSEYEDGRYADYYRSRYKEVEASLLEKDKKLHQAEQQIKEIQQSMKSSSENYKVINELQNKLSDATHKLSDRQLKIHELMREVDNLKNYENTYERKSKQCETLEDIVKDLERKSAEHKRNFHSVKQQMELLRIREIVLKEQLQTLIEEFSDDEDEDDERLRKSVDLKVKIDNLIESEVLVKKLTADLETLQAKNTELENRLRKINMESFKNIESAKHADNNGPLEESEKTEYEKKIQELERERFEVDDKYLNKIRILKEEHQADLIACQERQKDELDKRYCNEKETLEKMCEDLRSKMEGLSRALQKSLLEEQESHTNTKTLLEERTSALRDAQEELSSAREQASGDAYVLIEELRTKNDQLINQIDELEQKVNLVKNIRCPECAKQSEKVETFELFFDEEVFVTPKTSVSSEPDNIEAYKVMCKSYEGRVADMGKMLMLSQQDSIRLAQDLEKQVQCEDEFVSKYELLEKRMSEIQTKIGDSQDSLQSKADELEKERKNVIHLVEVTSAYIKELETSLCQAKQKNQELQNLVELSKEGGRQQPEGSSSSSDVIDSVEPTAGVNEEELTSSEWKAIQQKLTAKIMMLQSDISELRAERDALQNDTEDSGGALVKQKSIEEESEKVRQLQVELDMKEKSQQQEIEVLQQHFQTELKAAFGGDTGSYEMLNRIQELEIALEDTRKTADGKIKEMQRDHEMEKQQMQDDMATVLQASLGSMMEGADENRSATTEELEERVLKLEEELREQQERFDEEMQLEKEAHKQDMEDTIRDMMMVRDASNRLDDLDQTDSRGMGTKLFTLEEIEELKADFEKKLQMKVDDHEDQLEQVRQDMAIIVASVTQGNSSDAILELQSRVKDLEVELEESRGQHSSRVGELEANLKRADSINFFGLRRNEEMGSKIFGMQNELEEMERKHQIVVQTYQDQLKAAGVQVEVGEDVMKWHDEMEEKNKQLQADLDRLCKERDNEMEAYAMRLQEEKREAIEEATDNVLRLEELIEDMKQKHGSDKAKLERASNTVDSSFKTCYYELQMSLENQKEEYEEEIQALTQEHRREVEKLRVFYDKELNDTKRNVRKTSVVDQGSLAKNISRELRDKHEKEMEELRASYELSHEQAKTVQQREIEDIRMQYDEKLKLSYQDGMRRQSVSERKSDATKMRELIAEKEALSTRMLEIEIKHEKETATCNRTIDELRRIIAELRGLKTGTSANRTSPKAEVACMAEDEAEKKLTEIQDQIDRYNRRIEYYREKSRQENCEESHRVSELQSEIVELHNQLESVKNSKRKAVYEKEKKEKVVMKGLTRRNTDDGGAMRRHTDETGQRSCTLERDPRQRWSNLEERTETITKSISELDGKKNPKLTTQVKKEDVGKSGTVLARKTLWENIRDEPRKARSSLGGVK